MSKFGNIINSKSNVLIDPKSTLKKTNNYGEALFNLFFVSGKNTLCLIITILLGKPGKYKISFSSNENKIKTLSSSFELVNPIQSVDILTNMSHEISVNYTLKNFSKI